MKKLFKTWFKNPKPLQKARTLKTVTFKDKDQLFVFTVRWAFIRQCPKPETCDIEKLVVKHNFNRYLHNATGPAVIYTTEFPKEVLEHLRKYKNLSIKDGVVSGYWWNGNLLSFDQWNKLRSKEL